MIDARASGRNGAVGGLGAVAPPLAVCNSCLCHPCSRLFLVAVRSTSASICVEERVGGDQFSMVHGEHLCFLGGACSRIKVLFMEPILDVALQVLQIHCGAVHVDSPLMYPEVLCQFNIKNASLVHCLYA